MDEFNDPTGEADADIFEKVQSEGAVFWKILHEKNLKARYARKPPPIRDQIFTSELKSLAREVRSHTVPLRDQPQAEMQAGSRPSSFIRFEDVLPDQSGLFQLVMRLHAAQKSSLPSQLLEDLQTRYGAQSSALMLFSREEAVFSTAASVGLDAGTRKNLWIPIHDPFIDQDALVRIPVTDSLKSNPFFRKRFSEEFLSRLKSIVVGRRADLLFPSMVLLFYEESEPEEIQGEPVREFLDWVHPLLIRQTGRRSDVQASRNIYAHAAREVRAFLSMGRGGILVQFHFDNMRDRETCARFIREVRQALFHGRNCLALRIRHDELKLLLPDSEPDRDQMVRTIETLAVGFGVSVRWEQQVVGAHFVSSMVL